MDVFRRFKIGIIIINYKNLDETIFCLKSIYENIAFMDHAFEVILVDNSATVESNELLKDLFPEIKLISLSDNLGFAGGNNIGIINATSNNCDFIFLLNNDASLGRETLNHLVEVFERDPTIGIVGATIIDHYKKPLRIENMGALINYYTGNTTFVANGELFLNNHSDIDVDYACGAGMMIKREVFEKVGLLPEYYFLYGEEKDFCVQVKRAGYRVVISAKATVLHKASSTVKRYIGLKNYYYYRNRLIFQRKYAKAYQYIFSIFYSFFVIFPRQVFICVVNDDSSKQNRLIDLFSFISGLIDGIRCKTGRIDKYLA